MTTIRSALLFTLLLASGCAHVPRTSVGATTLESGECVLSIDWDDSVRVDAPTYVFKAPGVERVTLACGEDPGTWLLEWATATERHALRLAHGGPGRVVRVDEKVNTIEDKLKGRLSYVRAQAGGSDKLGFCYRAFGSGSDLLVEADGRLTLLSD